jgi:hypothetical protein
MKALAKLASVAAVPARIVAAGRTKLPAEEAEALPELTDEDRAHVEAWVAEEVQRLRALSYDQLLQHEGQDLQSERLTPSGAYVMCETSVFWDDPDARTLRVFVEATQTRSGWMPPSVAEDDFIRAPDGSFISD